MIKTVVLVTALLAGTLSWCTAAVIPADHTKTLDKLPAPAAPPQEPEHADKTFLVPPPGAPPGAPPGVGPGAARAVGEPSGQPAGGAEPALVGRAAVAATVSLDPQPALDAPAAGVRHPQPDAGLGGLGGLVAGRLLGMVNSSPESLSVSAEKDPASKASFLDLIVAALSSAGYHHKEPPPQVVTEIPPEVTTGNLHEMIHPKKKPKFSESYLPALLQVLSHVVDSVIEREDEQAASEAMMETATASTTESKEPSSTETLVTSTTETLPLSTTETLVPSTTPAEGESAPAPTPWGEDVEVIIRPPGVGTEQLVIHGPLQDTLELLSHIALHPLHELAGKGKTSAVHDTVKDFAVLPKDAVKDSAVPAKDAVEVYAVLPKDAVKNSATGRSADVIRDASKDSSVVTKDGVKASAVSVIGTAENTPVYIEDTFKSSAVPKGVVGEPVEDAKVKATLKDANMMGAVNDVIKAVKEVSVDSTKVHGTVKADKMDVVKSKDVESKSHSMDADEDMMEDMPVVQSDVPIVNEETVPMMMMINMVPSDAPEMVMGLLQAASEDSPVAPVQRTRRQAPIFPDEFKSFVYYPTLVDDTTKQGGPAVDEVDDLLEKTDFENMDRAYLLNAIRGETSAVATPTKRKPSATLIKLAKLHFVLSLEAKQQRFKEFMGFSTTVLNDLIKTSELSGADQLGVLLAKVVHDGDIKSTKAKKRAQEVLEELEHEDSNLYVSLKGIPALKYAP